MLSKPTCPPPEAPEKPVPPALLESPKPSAEVFDSIGEVTGIAQDLGRENQQLKEDNRSLSEKLAGWQKWNAERTQRVTVVGEKKG